jgi:hypothetical protein
MIPRILSRVAPLLPALVLPLALLASGCGDGGVGKTYRVNGKVTLNGELLVSKTAVVLFKPDTAKGNTTSFDPAGSLDSSGNYTLYTKTQRGAPPGWYKVIVTATESASPPVSKQPRRERPLPISLIPAKYGLAKSTPLNIEVVESPASSAYDLILSK